LEMRLLAALGQHAQQVTITLLADPDAAGIRHMRAGSAQEVALFSRTERLYRRLHDEFRRHQVRVEGTVALRKPFRFDDPGIARIESELFDGPAERVRAASHETPALPPTATARSGRKKKSREEAT